MTYGFLVKKGENLCYGQVHAGSLTAIDFYFAEDGLGDLYRVHPGNPMPQIKGRFCGLEDGRHGFLPDHDNPKPQETQIVQVTHGPANGKPAKLTARPEISGELFSLSLTPGRLGFPKKMAQADRDRIAGVLGHEKGDLRAQVRSLAGQATKEELKAAWTGLKAQAQRLAQAIHFDPTPAKVHSGGFTFYDWAKRLKADGITEIHITDMDLARTWKADFPLSAKGFDFKVIDDPLTYDPFVREGIQRALEREVITPQGIRLRFDSLETLTVIDVDSAGVQGKTRLAINLEAGEAICDLLALRNIGGMVVVDFITMKADQDRQAVVSLMTKTLKDKDLRPRVYGFTPMGLFELTLTRQGDPFALSYERFNSNKCQ